MSNKIKTKMKGKKLQKRYINKSLKNMEPISILGLIRLEEDMTI
jgi:hypothetical protein